MMMMITHPLGVRDVKGCWYLLRVVLVVFLRMSVAELILTLVATPDKRSHLFYCSSYYYYMTAADHYVTAQALSPTALSYHRARHKHHDRVIEDLASLVRVVQHLLLKAITSSRTE